MEKFTHAIQTKRTKDPSGKFSVWMQMKTAKDGEMSKEKVTTEKQNNKGREEKENMIRSNGKKCIEKLFRKYIIV